MDFNLNNLRHNKRQRPEFCCAGMETVILSTDSWGRRIPYLIRRSFTLFRMTGKL